MDYDCVPPMNYLLQFSFSLAGQHPLRLKMLDGDDVDDALLL